MYLKELIMQKRKATIIYLIIVVLLFLGFCYLITPRFSYRDIRLGMTKETVTAREAKHCNITPEIKDNAPDELSYKNVPISSNVNATIDYDFDKTKHYKLTSIFITIPITSDNSDSIKKYITDTFPIKKDASEFTLNTNTSFIRKSTCFSLFLADNLNAYCIHITYKYKGLPW